MNAHLVSELTGGPTTGEKAMMGANEILNHPHSHSHRPANALKMTIEKLEQSDSRSLALRAN